MSYDSLIKQLRITGRELQTTSTNTRVELIAADAIAKLQAELAEAQKGDGQ